MVIEDAWVLAKVELFQDCLFNGEPELLKNENNQIISFSHQKYAWDYLQYHNFSDYIPIKHKIEELSNQI